MSLQQSWFVCRACKTLLVAFSTALASCDAQPPDPAQAGALADIARELKTTNELLRKIELAVGQSTAREPSSNPDTLVREEAQPPPTEWAERLTESLAEQFRAIHTQLDALPSAMAHAEPIPRREPLVKQLDAVTAAIDRFVANPEAERARHFQWTQAEVFGAYGTPDGMSIGPLQVSWYYTLPSLKGQLTFTFSRGQSTTEVVAERFQ